MIHLLVGSAAIARASGSADGERQRHPCRTVVVVVLLVDVDVVLLVDVDVVVTSKANSTVGSRKGATAYTVVPTAVASQFPRTVVIGDVNAHSPRPSSAETATSTDA